MRIQDEPVPSAETVGIIRSLSFAFVRVYAVRMAAVLSYLELLILVFPAWVAAVSVVILRVGRGVSSRAAR